MAKPKFKTNDIVVLEAAGVIQGLTTAGDIGRVVGVISENSYSVQFLMGMMETSTPWGISGDHLTKAAAEVSKQYKKKTVRHGDPSVIAATPVSAAPPAPIKLKVKRLTPDAVMPSKAHEDDAGYDLTVIDDGKQVWPAEEPTRAYLYLEYGTGLALEIPAGHVGLIFPRSSQSKTGLILANCVGVIDAGYRGEIKFRFKVDGAGLVLAGTRGILRYKAGDRAGQLIIMPLPVVTLEEVTDLSGSSRGQSGFGSSGQ